MKKVIALSCWFGDRFSKPKKLEKLGDLKSLIFYIVKSFLPTRLLIKLNFDTVIPTAPRNCVTSIFFTNNKKLKREIELKGWRYYYLESSVDGQESINSSLQAKAIKFLQLPLDIMNYLSNFDYVLYMDSRRVTDDVFDLIKLEFKGITIRYTPKEKYLFDEVEEAKGQERYMKAMGKTEEFINEKISTGAYTSNFRVSNTGVILYNFQNKLLVEKSLELCKEVYDACEKLKQPECQIIWCLLSQNYKSIVNQVHFDTINTRNK